MSLGSFVDKVMASFMKVGNSFGISLKYDARPPLLQGSMECPRSDSLNNYFGLIRLTE